MIKKLLDLLTPSECKRAGILPGLILTMALLDMIGMASIMAVLAKRTNAVIKTAYAASSHLGIDTTGQFLFLLGMLFFVLLLVSPAFKALTTHTQLRFILMREYSIGQRLVEGYLHQPYSWFFEPAQRRFGQNHSLGGEVSWTSSLSLFTAASPTGLT